MGVPDFTFSTKSLENSKNIISFSFSNLDSNIKEMKKGNPAILTEIPIIK